MQTRSTDAGRGAVSDPPEPRFHTRTHVCAPCVGLASCRPAGCLDSHGVACERPPSCGLERRGTQRLQVEGQAVKRKHSVLDAQRGTQLACRCYSTLRCMAFGSMPVRSSRHVTQGFGVEGPRHCKHARDPGGCDMERRCRTLKSRTVASIVFLRARLPPGDPSMRHGCLARSSSSTLSPSDTWDGASSKKLPPARRARRKQSPTSMAPLEHPHFGTCSCVAHAVSQMQRPYRAERLPKACIIRVCLSRPCTATMA